MNQTIKICEVLVSYGRKRILKEFRKDSCIVSTAIAIDVLKHYGIKALPFPIRIIVANKAAADQIEKCGLPKEGELVQWWDEFGAWTIGLGFGEGPNNEVDDGKWACHLTALVEDKFLLDLSLDQASRPERNLVLDPLFCNLPKDFKDQSVSVLQSESGLAMVVYKVKPPIDFKKSPDWYDAKRRRHIVLSIIHEVDKCL